MGQVIHTPPRADSLTARVLKVMSVFTGIQAVQIGCGMVRTKMLSIWTGVEGVALYGVLSVALELFGTLSQTGLRTAAVRHLAADSGRLGLMSRVVSRWGVWLGLATAVLMVLTAPWLSRLSHHGSLAWTWPFVILAIALFGNSVASANQAILQGAGRLRTIATTTWWIYPLSLLVALPLIYLWRLHGVAPMLAAAGVISAIVFAWARRRDIPTLTPGPRVSELWHNGLPLMRLGVMLSISALAAWGATYLFMAWLDNRGGDTAVGLYQAGNTLVYRYLGLIFTAMSFEFYPRLSSLRPDRRLRAELYVRHELGVVLRVAVPLMCVFCLASPLAVRIFYTSDFIGTVPYITIAAPATVLRALGWCLAFVILSRGDGRLFLITEVSSALLALVLNITGYALGGMAGLGWAYIAWYVIYALVVTIIVRRRYGIAPSRRQIGAVLLSLCAGGACAALTMTLMAV